MIQLLVPKSFFKKKRTHTHTHTHTHALYFRLCEYVQKRQKRQESEINRVCSVSLTNNLEQISYSLIMVNYKHVFDC